MDLTGHLSNLRDGVRELLVLDRPAGAGAAEGDALVAEAAIVDTRRVAGGGVAGRVGGGGGLRPAPLEGALLRPPRRCNRLRVPEQIAELDEDRDADSALRDDGAVDAPDRSRRRRAVLLPLRGEDRHGVPGGSNRRS